MTGKAGEKDLERARVGWSHFKSKMRNIQARKRVTSDVYLDNFRGRLQIIPGQQFFGFL